MTSLLETTSQGDEIIDKKEYETFETWEDSNLNLNENLLRGIYSHGFSKPSPIQQKSIISIINGKDIIAQAQSGTGKTGAFSIGALQRINVDEHKTQLLLLSPTRELAMQSYNVISSLSKNMKINIKLFIGGTNIEKDIKDLKNNTPHVVIGCTGRVYDLMRRNHLDYNNIKLMILDEADEMLSIGFKEQVYEIFQYLNNEIQICLFSATMPTEIETMTKKFMRDPIKILIKTEMLTLEGIGQYYIAFDDEQSKFEALKDLYMLISVSQCIIYCNSTNGLKIYITLLLVIISLYVEFMGICQKKTERMLIKISLMVNIGFLSLQMLQQEELTFSKLALLLILIYRNVLEHICIESGVQVDGEEKVQVLIL